MYSPSDADYLRSGRVFKKGRSQLLVLDEPTAALDSRSESEIYSRFSELVRVKMAILVTHRLASVSMCDCSISFKSWQTNRARHTFPIIAAAARIRPSLAYAG